MFYKKAVMIDDGRDKNRVKILMGWCERNVWTKVFTNIFSKTVAGEEIKGCLETILSI